MSSTHDSLDDRLTTVFSSLNPTTTYFSLEFFPPKTQAGFTNLQNRLSRMSTALRPLFVTVTWGAGGSTASKSLELAEVCQRQLGLTTVLHLTCTNMKRKMVDEALEEAKEIGIRNILALRGDPPREEYKEQDDIPDANSGDEFVWAIDLVTYIRKKYGDYFCVGVAGYPEGHADESHPEAGKQSVEHDLPYLADKVAAGADFIMTQLTYDAAAYRKYEARLRGYEDPKTKKRLFETIPIIPGLMPIQSYQILKRITKLSHAKVPDDIAERIEKVKTDDDMVKKVGVDILSELVEEIKSMPQPENVPRGLHFYTLNLEKSVAFILERCHLIPTSRDTTPSEETSDSDAVVEIEPVRSKPSQTNGVAHTQQRSRRRSSINAQPHNRVILDRPSKSPAPSSTIVDLSQTIRHEAPTKGTGVPASDPTRKQKLMISEGHGSLGREATWDDFPNGRWGPSHSPAFGEIDGYGPSLKVGPVTARKLWGHPRSATDVTSLFRRHVLGELEAVPWSDEVDVDGFGSGGGNGALRAETMVIRRELLGLIEQKGYWTLASQPAVNGVRSDDETFGWGPKGEGFVFQKAFVEFFCPRNEWESRLKPKLSNTKLEDFSWMKIDSSGVFEASDGLNGRVSGNQRPATKPAPTNSGINAVTWGVFRGKEIVTPTIIESESFRAWGEEAFSIWSEWRRCFPKGSEEDSCLQKLRDGVVLVNVVGHKFIGGHDGEGAGLWRILLDES